MADEVRQLLAHALKRSRDPRVRDSLARCTAAGAGIAQLYAAAEVAADAGAGAQPDAALLATLAKAINVALAGAERTRHVTSLVVRPQVARIPVASRLRPEPLAFERAAFDGTEREGTLALPPTKNGPSAEATAAFFEARPEAPVRPERAGRLVEVAGDTSPRPRRELQAEVVAACADNIAMLARHRDERPQWERPENEEALLANVDAIGASGGHCVRMVVDWWRKAGDPWQTWAGVFVLACFNGTDTLDAIARELEQLPADADDHVLRAAEALLGAPNPHVRELALDLSESPNPIARAIGIEVLGRRRLLAPDRVRSHARDPNLPVLTAVIRSSMVLGKETGAPFLVPFLQHRSRDVVWSAASQLARWQRPEPYLEVRQGRCLPLGVKALEVLIQFGDATDLDRFDDIVAREPATPELLSAIGRFGEPSAWAYLVHHLADPELSGAATRALATLFGPIVPHRETTSSAAWREAISRAEIQQGVRIRAGKPWSPAALGAEVLAGDVDRAELQARLDELTTRVGVALDVDLAAWSPDRGPAVERAMRACESVFRSFRVGSWDSKAVGARA